MVPLKQQVRSVFNEAQRGVQLHTKLVTELQNIQKLALVNAADVTEGEDEVLAETDLESSQSQRIEEFSRSSNSQSQNSNSQSQNSNSQSQNSQSQSSNSQSQSSNSQRQNFRKNRSFTELFLNHLRHVMIVYKREPAVERSIDFVARFLTSLNKPSIGESVKEEKSSQEDGHLSDDDEEDFMNPLLEFIFNFLLDSHNANDRAVRFRSCQLINKLLTYMDENVSIDGDLADRIYDCMLMRLRDKVPAIRVQAVLALYRLQDPTDEDCPVISSFLHLMENDNNPEVRRAVLGNIAMRTTTLYPIIARTRDVKELVRKTAFKVLSEKVNIKALSIAQRLQLLNDGLHDRCQTVKDVCSTYLIKSWLKGMDNNAVKFLECLHVESSPEIAEKTLKNLFQGASPEDLKMHVDVLKALSIENSNVVDIPCDKLGPEVALFWKSLVQHVTSMGTDGQNLMDQLLPEASKFCEYVEGFIHRRPIECDFASVSFLDETISKVEFILRQFLQLIGMLDLSDEIGRKRIVSLVHDLLLDDNIPASLVDLLVARYIDAQTSEEERFVQSLVEIISDISEPMVLPTSKVEELSRKRQMQIAKLTVDINETKEQLNLSIKEEDFYKAAEMKKKLNTLEEQKTCIEDEDLTMNQTMKLDKDDPVTITKCLTIASEMLQKVNKRGLTPTLRTLVQTLILPAMQNEDPLIRNIAVKCLGLSSLLSKDFAHQHIVLFLQVAQIDQEIVRVTAIQVIFDLLQVYGVETFTVKEEEESEGDKEKSKETTHNNDSPDKMADDNEEDEEEKDIAEEAGEAAETGNAGTSILNILMVLLDSECPEIRTLAAEGMAKLMLSGRLISVKLLSRLVLLWYNPTVEEDLQLRHCLGVFLPVYAFTSRANQELIADAFIPILRTLFNAPDRSPLSTVNPDNVTELLIQLCNPRHLRENTKTSSARTESNVQELQIHESLALKIANEILSEPSDPNNKVLIRVLTLLEISPSNQDNVKDLQVLCTQMTEEIKDRASVKLLAKFKKNLDLLKTADTAELQSSQSSQSQPSQSQSSQ